MALFRDPAFDTLEETFLTGKTFGEGDVAFTLILCPIETFPRRILDYRWTVKLADDYEFEAYMGELVLSPEHTRFHDIQKKIAKSSCANKKQIAQKIDLAIQSILDEYVNFSSL
ncbi:MULTISPECIES: hypothetical protein [Bacillus cereus group]|uniref:hypothetical protein n=1 Tax=Bacillus cereus group TaxID=86661 RepID=UPI000BFD5203|nr:MULTISPECIES: hypothetical protein [Bacillus cereus group]PHG45980.1 hypothetical protein COI54_16700 [Bacillus wiedmannii]